MKIIISFSLHNDFDSFLQKVDFNIDVSIYSEAISYWSVEIQLQFVSFNQMKYFKSFFFQCSQRRLISINRIFEHDPTNETSILSKIILLQSMITASSIDYEIPSKQPKSILQFQSIFRFLSDISNHNLQYLMKTFPDQSHLSAHMLLLRHPYWKHQSTNDSKYCCNFFRKFVNYLSSWPILHDQIVFEILKISYKADTNWGLYLSVPQFNSRNNLEDNQLSLAKIPVNNLYQDEISYTDLSRILH